MNVRVLCNCKNKTFWIICTFSKEDCIFIRMKVKMFIILHFDLFLVHHRFHRLTQIFTQIICDLFVIICEICGENRKLIEVIAKS